MSQRVEPLLAAMAAGIVIANVAVAQGDALKAAIRSGALPLLVVFFVAVGTSLRLDTLAAAGCCCNRSCRRAHRADLDRCANRTARAEGQGPSRASTSGPDWSRRRVSRSGLAAAVATEFPTWGAQVQMLLVALIAIDELVGPALFRTGLVRDGRNRCDGATAAAGRVEPRAVSSQLRRARAHYVCARRPVAWRSRSTR